MRTPRQIPEPGREREAASDKLRRINDARTACLEACAKDRETNYLFIGNPGTGKSTLLNALIGKVAFKSGVSYGSGMTFQLDMKKVGKNTYMDTPGLEDEDKREQAANAISGALRCGGAFKICFVITLESGRIRPSDKATMELVLKSAPIDSYGIIINKMSKKVLKNLMFNPRGEDPSPIDKVVATLWGGHGKKTEHIFYNLKNDDLEDENDVLADLPPPLRQFIEGLPVTGIRPDDVKDIPIDEFMAMMKGMEMQLKKLNDDNQEIRDSLTREQKKYKTLQAELAAALAELSSKKGGWCPIM